MPISPQFQALLPQFRSQYSMGCLCTELLAIQQGQYVVRALVRVGELVLATAMAAAAEIETAEDQAKVRVLESIGLGVSSPTGATAMNLRPGLGGTKPTLADERSSNSSKPELQPEVSTPVTSWSLPERFAMPEVTTPSTPTTVQTLASTASTTSTAHVAEITPAPVAQVNAPVTQLLPEDDRPYVDRDSEQTDPDLNSGLTSSGLTSSGLTSSGLTSGLASPDLTDSGLINSAPDEAAVSVSTFEPEATRPELASLPTDSAEKSTPEKSTPEKSTSEKSAKRKTTAMIEEVATPAPQADRSEEIMKIGIEMKRLGWSTEQGREHLKRTYNKRSRQELNDAELLDFLHYLELQSSPLQTPF